jgi:hypothetical protein
VTLLVATIRRREEERVYPPRAALPAHECPERLDGLMVLVVDDEPDAAMWLLARARAESWLYWIMVDVIGIWLYYVKEVRLVALLYVLLLGMAAGGLLSWRKAAKGGLGA